MAPCHFHFKTAWTETASLDLRTGLLPHPRNATGGENTAVLAPLALLTAICRPVSLSGEAQVRLWTGEPVT